MLITAACAWFLGTAVLAAQPAISPLAGEDYHPTRLLAKSKKGERIESQHPALRQHGLQVLRCADLASVLAVLELEDRAQAAAIIKTGATVDAVVASLPRLSRAQAYECLAYYEDHKSEIDPLFAEQTAHTDG